MYVRVLDQNRQIVPDAVRLGGEVGEVVGPYVEVHRVVSVTHDADGEHSDGCKRAHVVGVDFDGYVVTAQPGESIEFYN